MYQKSTEFFVDPQLKRFSGNKPQKLTKNGPKRCIFRQHKIWKKKQLNISQIDVDYFLHIDTPY